MGEKVHNIKKKTEALVIVTKKIGLEVNADKIKYMTMPLYQKEGRRHNIKFHNISLKGGRI